MAWTIDDYNALKDAMKSGAVKVKYADKEVTYRSLAEMTSLLNAMAKELGLGGKSSIQYPEVNKGFTT